MGMENILKQLLLHKNVPISESATWHKDMLNTAIEHYLITKATADDLGKYLLFRHFFIPSYGFLIEEAKLEPLMSNIPLYMPNLKEK